MRLALNLEEVSEINIAANCDAKIFEIEFPGEELGEEDAWETQAWAGARHFIEARVHHELPAKAQSLYHSLLNARVEQALETYDREVPMSIVQRIYNGAKLA